MHRINGFKSVGISALAAMLIFSVACNTAKNPTATPTPSAEVQTVQPTAEVTKRPIFSTTGQDGLHEGPYEYPVSDLTFDDFDTEEFSKAGRPDQGFTTLYCDDKSIVLYSEDGLFVYSFEQEKITIGIDFMKVFGVHGCLQGDPGDFAGASVSSDGEIIMIARYMEGVNREWVIKDSYYIHIPSMTYIWGNYGELENKTDFEPIDSLENGMEFYNELVIEHNGNEYKIFEDTSFVNGK